MKLSLAVAVVLRMFAIYWLATALLVLCGSLANPASYYGFSNLVTKLMPLIVPGIYLLFAIVAWIFADGISKKVTGALDPELQAGELNAANLYSLGFLIVGLWFCLSYLGPMINWIHYFAVAKAGAGLMSEGENNFVYEFSSQGVPCIAGLMLALTSPHLGRKMAVASARRQIPAE